MAIDVSCECGREFCVTNDSLGQSVKCPECGSWVRVHEESSRKQADSKPTSPESRESKSARQKAKAAYSQAESAFHNSSVPLGITWIYYGLLIGVIAMIGLCSMVLLSGAGQPGLGSLLMVPFGLAMVVAVGLLLVGKFFCLSAPSQIPGSSGAWLSLVFDGFVVLIAIAQRGQGGGLSMWANLLAVGSLFSFLVFLNGLGKFLELRDIADRAAKVLKLGLLSLMLWITQIAYTILVQARAVPPDIGGIGQQMQGVVLGGVWIFVLVRFAGLLSMCRSALSKP